MDYGRKFDLELLTKEYEQAKYQHDRDEIYEVIKKIMRSSVPINSLREDLLKAMRAGDRVAVKKITMHINRVKQDETYGREIS